MEYSFHQELWKMQSASP